MVSSFKQPIDGSTMINIFPCFFPTCSSKTWDLNEFNVVYPSNMGSFVTSSSEIGNAGLEVPPDGKCMMFPLKLQGNLVVIWCSIRFQHMTGWWFGTFFIFSIYWEQSFQLTNIFQSVWNHQPDDVFQHVVLLLSGNDKHSYWELP